MSNGESDAARPERSGSARDQNNLERCAAAPTPCLSLVDKKRLERLFKMNNGYVLDLTNQHLADLVQETTGRNLYADEYAEWGDSKAKRLRSFWSRESPELVGKVIRGLLDYYPYADSTGGDAQLVADCERIASRLLGEPVPVGGNEERTRQPIDAEFKFEAGTVTLASGEMFIPTQNAVERWGLIIRSMYEAAGNGVELLYQTADDQFILVKAHIGPPDFYSEKIEHAAIVGLDEARAWLQRSNLMLPECLMKGVKTFPTVPREVPKAADPSPTPAPDGTPHAVNIGNWAEGGKAFAEAFNAVNGIGNTGSKADEVKRETSADDKDDEQQDPALTKSERITLAALARFDPSRLASAGDVTEAMPAAERLSDRTARLAINKLVKLDLAERPEGEKQGTRLTMRGRRLATKIAD